MANGDQNYFTDHVREEQSIITDSESLIKETSLAEAYVDNTLAMAGDLQLNMASLEEVVFNNDVVTFTDTPQEGQFLAYDGSNGWVGRDSGLESVAESVIGRKVTRADGSGFIAFDCTPYGDCEEIFVNGKPCLLIDNSGPEEMNPHKLQERIVEMRKELDEAIGLIPGPVAEGASLKDLPPDPAEIALKQFELAVAAGLSDADLNFFRNKLAESLSLPSGTVADEALEFFEGNIVGKEDANDSPYIPFGPYSCNSGYTGLPDLSIASYGPGAASFDLSDISLVAEPTSEECKIVSQKDADYDRAMNMIGK